MAARRSCSRIGCVPEEPPGSPLACLHGHTRLVAHGYLVVMVSFLHTHLLTWLTQESPWDTPLLQPSRILLAKVFLPLQGSQVLLVKIFLPMESSILWFNQDLLWHHIKCGLEVWIEVLTPFSLLGKPLPSPRKVRVESEQTHVFLVKPGYVYLISPYFTIFLLKQCPKACTLRRVQKRSAVACIRFFHSTSS